MNILTFDIEDWYLEKHYFGNHANKIADYDRYLDKILETLNERKINGTFFCIGGMVTDFPDVVRKIEACGHEIGCHSYKHVWLNKMSYDEVYEDTRTSIDALEQCLGKKVLSYRAPAFSIGVENKWAFEILSRCGIKRDASVYPAVREFGGFSQFGEKRPVMISCNQFIIKEFPICTTTFLGKELAYSGGGYFRFFPLPFIRNTMKRAEYSMTYFHLLDLVPDSFGVMSKEDFGRYFKIPGTLKNRYMRYVKMNVGKKSAFEKLLKLIDSEEFVNLEQADSMIDWQGQNVVKL